MGSHTSGDSWVGESAVQGSGSNVGVSRRGQGEEEVWESFACSTASGVVGMVTPAGWRCRLSDCTGRQRQAESYHAELKWQPPIDWVHIHIEVGYSRLNTSFSRLVVPCYTPGVLQFKVPLFAGTILWLVGCAVTGWGGFHICCGKAGHAVSELGVSHQYYDGETSPDLVDCGGQCSYWLRLSVSIWFSGVTRWGYFG